MSSTEITTFEDACNRPTFPLPIELRMKVYEQLLVCLDGSLKPHGFQRYTVKSHYRGEKCISIDILLTCRTIYEEALPILYGKNVLAFHDNNIFKRVLPFPEEHLIMIKHVKVEMSPSNYNSAEKIGSLLMTLGTSRAKLIDLSIRIHMLEGKDVFRREYHHILPPSRLHGGFLPHNHPIVVALFSLKAVKKLDIDFEGEVRFEPGVANALRESFMKKQTTISPSITIRKACSISHEALELKEECFRCGNTKESLGNGIGYCEYQDDMVTRRLAEQFNKHKRREAVEMIRREIKANNSQNGRRYTTATKKTKAKFAKTFSRSAAR